MKKRLLIMCALLIMSVFAGCSENISDSVSDSSTESTSHIHAENPQLCMENVQFVAKLFHNHQTKQYDDTDIFYYFVVLNDGTVWTMNNNYKADNYDFVKKFAGHDDSGGNLPKISKTSAVFRRKIQKSYQNIFPQ